MTGKKKYELKEEETEKLRLAAGTKEYNLLDEKLAGILDKKLVGKVMETGNKIIKIYGGWDELRRTAQKADPDTIEGRNSKLDHFLGLAAKTNDIRMLSTTMLYGFALDEILERISEHANNFEAKKRSSSPFLHNLLAQAQQSKVICD